MQADAEARAYEALSAHVRGADLAAITRTVMTAAVEARSAAVDRAKVAEAATARGLEREQAGTDFGNALDVLERGPETDVERALACALAARGLASDPPKERDAQERAAGELLWLAAHTPFDATELLDAALGEHAGAVWEAIAERVRRADEGKLPASDRGEALIGAVALAASRSESASKHAAALAAAARDPKIARV